MASNHEREVLRSLARRVREIAEQPAMAQCKRRWYAHNALHGDGPLVLCFPEGAWPELVPDSVLECDDERLRTWERRLRMRVYWWEHIHDDAATEPFFDINWVVNIGDYGVPIPYTHGAHRGSYVWDPPVKNLDEDLGRLRFRSLDVDRQETQRQVELAEGLFGDLLPVRIRGWFWWTTGLTWEAVKLIGLEPLMLNLHDNPVGIHRLMGWLRDEHLHFVNWFEREGLLSPQNESDYVGSGGLGYTDELPQSDWQPGDAVRLIDCWGFAESQETVGISPAMFDEFVLPYQLPLLQRFGLNCYGCCEPVHHRLDSIVKQVPRLRRISASPWVDQQAMADKTGRDYIFSRKPNPAIICATFDEDQIRQDLRDTLHIAGHAPLEIIMKDTHTVQNEPWRISRWVQIATEEVDRWMSAAKQ